MVFLGWSHVWRMRNSSLFKHDEAFLEMKYLIKTHTSISKAPLTFLKLMNKTFHRIKCLIIKVNNSVYVAMVPDWPYLTSWKVQCTYVSPFWPSVHKKTGFEGTKKAAGFKNGLQGILSRVEILENTGFLFTCGRTKNCYDNIKHHKHCTTSIPHAR